MEFGLKCKKSSSCQLWCSVGFLYVSMYSRAPNETGGKFILFWKFYLYTPFHLINKKIMHTFFFHMNKFQKNFNYNLIPISCCIRNSRVPHKDTYRQRSKSFDVVFQIPSLLPTESRSNPQWLKGVAKSKNQKHSRLLPFIKCLFELVWNIALPSKSIQS